MLYRLLPSTSLPHKATRGCEDTSTLLPRLHGPGHEALSIPHTLNVVKDGDRAVAREHEVAVHAVDEVLGGGGRDGGLRGRETLSYYGTAVDAPGAWGVPEFAGVGEDVLWKH